MCSFFGMAGSCCQRIAPRANWDASTSSSNWQSWSRAMRTGLEVMTLIRVLRDLTHLGVQMNGLVFLRRAVRGHAMAVKFGIKGC